MPTHFTLHIASVTSTKHEWNYPPAHAANGHARQAQPNPPVDGKRVSLLIVEAGYAVECREREEEQHRVK